MKYIPSGWLQKVKDENRDHIWKNKIGLRKVENIFYIHANNSSYEMDYHIRSFYFFMVSLCAG